MKLDLNHANNQVPSMLIMNTFFSGLLIIVELDANIVQWKILLTAEPNA